MPNLIIPPRDLPLANEVFATDALVVDNGASVSKATPVQVVDAGRPWATIQEAQDGTASGVSMSPLTTAAAVRAQVSGAINNATAGIRPYASYEQALAIAPNAPAESLSISAIVAGRETVWIRDGNGTCLGGGWAPAGKATPQHYGAFGTGISDDGAALALMGMSEHDVEAPAGIYRIVNRTIDVQHPFRIVGAGSGVTQFCFEGMGGFSGKDGFNVNVQITPDLLHSTTEFADCDVLIDTDYGRAGIKTPANQSGTGAELYATVRPRFIFTRMALGSRFRTAPASSSMFGRWGWANCIHLGESADSEITHIRFIQPFLVNIPQAEWAMRQNCTGAYLDAGEADAGSGAVYHTLVDHITAHGCGAVVKCRGRVVSPKIGNIDAISSGWGILSTSSFYSPQGRLDSISEPVIYDSNLPGLFGGIYIEGTDFCEIRTVRTSRPSFAGIDHTGPWFGLKVANGFRQLDVRGFRASVSGAAVPSEIWMLDVNGQLPTEDGAPGVLNLKDLYINTQISPSAWGEPIAIRNVREALIDPPKVRSTGVWGNMLYHTTNVYSIPPKISMTAMLPYSFSGAVTNGPGASSSQLYWPRVNRGFFNFSTASSSGGQAISPRNASKYRQQFNSGGAAYTYDYTISNDGAIIGQEVDFFLSIVASTFPTIRFLDHTGAVQGTVQGQTSASTWQVIVVWADVGGVPTARVQLIVRGQ